MAASLAGMTLIFSGCQSINELESRLDSLLTGPVQTTDAPETIPGVIFTPETKPEETSAETASETEAPPAVNQMTLREILNPYLFAVSFTFYGILDPEPMTDPMTLWEAIGWYAGYQYLTDGVGSYSDDDIKKIQRCFTNSDEYIDCPDLMIDDEMIENADGTWRFGYFIESMVDYFGGYGVFNYQLDFKGLEAEGTIFQEIEGEEFSWTTIVTFGESESGYHILSVRIPDGGGEMPSGSYLIYEDGQEVGEDDFAIMVDQNDLSFLLQNGVRMKETSSSDYGDGSKINAEIYYYYEDGDIVQLATGDDINSAYYRGFDFHPDPKSGRVVCASQTRGSDDHKASDGMMEKMVSRELIFSEKWYITNENEETITISSGYEENGYVSRSDVVMDKGTFRIFEINRTFEYTEEGGGTSLVRWNASYEYSNDLELPKDLAGLISEFKGKTRKVTVVDLNGELASGTVTYDVPVSWEFSQYEGHTYMDENCSKPYEYPGDDIDYTIYISFAVG